MNGMHSKTRRALLQAALAATTAPLLTRAVAQTKPAARGTQLILLGTKGGPTPSALRAAPANVLLVDGRPYVIDCGNGVAIQLTKAGVPLGTIDHVFVTHQHSDHNADLGNLVFLAWATSLKTPVHLYGPPPMAKMMDDFAAMNAVDIAIRQSEEGRPPFKPLIRVKEITAGGLVMEDDRVRVTSALVDHYTLKPAFAYRFDTTSSEGRRSIVFSGDTTYSDALIELAKDADVLVHEVMYLPALQKMMATIDNAPTLLDHLLKSHTTTEQLGRIAAAANVKTLVLSHFVPGGDPSITDEMWTADVRTNYSGRIVIGRDLMTI
ncbi:MAG: MBL fold metallo-hydrolase [Burkholderiaceae bacterium]